ncbi:MAG: hypothetical protein H3C54_00030 [Taibaiella sp.]|nr:hypothetical protein [Taibaiella sp.]
MRTDKVFVAVVCIFLFTKAGAQEFSMGIHFSPIATIPMMAKPPVTNHPSLKAKKYNINASAGLNLNYRFNRLCIETGGNITTRSVTFRMNLDEYSYNSLGGSSSISSYSDTRSPGYAIGIPLQVGYLLDRHNAKTVYDFYGLLGASYEMHTTLPYSYGSVTSQTGSSITNNRNFYPGAGVKTNWVNIIAGFKINAILRRVGLIEYGLRYHFPLSHAGRYHVETVVSNGIYGSAFSGDFYPRLAYMDLHFTYYLLNYEKGTGRKKYRYN